MLCNGNTKTSATLPVSSLLGCYWFKSTNTMLMAIIKPTTTAKDERNIQVDFNLSATYTFHIIPVGFRVLYLVANKVKGVFCLAPNFWNPFARPLVYMEDIMYRYVLHIFLSYWIGDQCVTSFQCKLVWWPFFIFNWCKNP